MTPEQFHLISKLTRGQPDSPSNQAAFLVLCQGRPQADAMRETGATRSSVSDTVRRIASIHAEILAAYPGAAR